MKINKIFTIVVSVVVVISFTLLSFVFLTAEEKNNIQKQQNKEQHANQLLTYLYLQNNISKWNHNTLGVDFVKNINSIYIKNSVPNNINVKSAYITNNEVFLYYINQNISKTEKKQSITKTANISTKQNITLPKTSNNNIVYSPVPEIVPQVTESRNNYTVESYVPPINNQNNNPDEGNKFGFGSYDKIVQAGNNPNINKNWVDMSGSFEVKKRKERTYDVYGNTQEVASAENQPKNETSETLSSYQPSNSSEEKEAGNKQSTQTSNIAEIARKTLAVRKIYAGGCSGFVSFVLQMAGYGISGNCISIHQQCASSGSIHNKKYPSPGDIVFFNNTYDRNRDKKFNDVLTHIGIVYSVESDGTINYIHQLNPKAGVIMSQMNLLEPSNSSKNSGLGVSYGPQLSGMLFHSFASIGR